MVRKTSKEESKKTNLTALDILQSRSWKLSIRHEKDLMNVIHTKDLKQKVIEWLIEDFDENECETVVAFCRQRKIPRSTLNYWASNDKEFGIVFSNMKLLIADRYFRGALHKTLDKDVAFKNMHLLDPEFLGINAYHDGRTKEQNQNIHEITKNALMQVLADFEEAKKEPIDGEQAR